MSRAGTAQENRLGKLTPHSSRTAAKPPRASVDLDVVAPGL
eukprot:CAMPEP_0171199658 /NCGR_PEP_ID=MMETSP0790-20130122/23576_1 /TAXON_ID=2925 /ORGANISM="Alexandrium catenella, Strain OF101" /LENGTH=40 /DNA_ID= /DNA_START= /DNA_END= /DNA_ORIENTATION=